MEDFAVFLAIVSIILLVVVGLPSAIVLVTKNDEKVRRFMMDGKIALISSLLSLLLGLLGVVVSSLFYWLLIISFPISVLSLSIQKGLLSRAIIKNGKDV